MTLSELKELSARAAAYLPKLGDDREQFPAEAGDNYHGLKGFNSPHPLAGTIMVGETSGYYEPEWDEETAWGALCTHVYTHFTDWEKAAAGGINAVPELMRKLDTHAEIFAAADEMVAELLTPQGGSHEAI